MTKVVEASLKGKKTKAIKLPGNTLVFDKNKDVEDILYNAYSEKLQTGKVSGNSWLDNFVSKNLDTLEKNLTKIPETALYSMRELNKIVNSTNEYMSKKKAIETDFMEYQLFKQLLPWQKEVNNDLNKRKVLICSRRTGKTYYEAIAMVKHCLKGTDDILVGDRLVKKRRCCIYVALTIEKAVRNIWDTLKDVIELAKIPVDKIDNSKYRIDFSSGSYIMLAGNNNKKEREKLRGDDWSMAIVDEVQSQDAMYYVMESLLEPIVGARKGEIILSGTGPLIRGYWSDLIEKGEELGWSVYHKTVYDNFTVEDPDEYLAEALKKFGGDENNPTYQREYLGNICWDDNLLIYPKVTYYETIPKDFHPVYAYGGMDFGGRDRSAIVWLLIDDNSNAYLVSEFCQAELDATTIFNKAKASKELIQKQWNIPEENIRAAADTNEPNMTTDFYNRGLTFIEKAIKFPLKYSYAILNEAMATGKLKILKNGPVDIDCQKTCYKYDQERKMVIYEEDRNNWHEDATAALRYAWGNYCSSVLFLRSSDDQ